MTTQSQQDRSCVDVKTIVGKNYSVERYYMLSEIEQHALRPVYLNDHFCPDNTSELMGEGETVATVSSETEDYRCDIPPFIFLYLLWNCSDTRSSSSSEERAAKSFQKGPLEGALNKLETLLERNEQYREKNDPDYQTSSFPSNVYIVVDALLWSGNGESNNDREKHFQKYLAIMQALAQKVLKSDHNDERLCLCGATLGLADHARAAPGLEACLEAIMVGVRDRRRNSNNSNPKSCVGIVCHSLQDLVGYDEETETDAVQGVMQSLTHASFTNETTPPNDENDDDKQRSPIIDYAHKAHRFWRVHKAGLSPEPTPEELKLYEEFGSGKDASVWIIALLVFLVAFFWQK